MNISKDSLDMFDEQGRIFYFILPEDSEKALSLWSYTDNSVIFRPFTIKPGSPEQTSELQTNNCQLLFAFSFFSDQVAFSWEHNFLRIFVFQNLKYRPKPFSVRGVYTGKNLNL